MNRQWTISAAVAVVVAGMAQSAAAQFQTRGSSGNALDANNRLGSNGINDTRRDVGGLTADDIVYGNVTGGRQFRGNLNSTDPRAFRGNISRPSDNLVREAGPSAYQAQQTTDDRLNPRRFYGDSRGVNAPGFGQLQPGSPGQFDITRPVFRMPGDLRMDATIPNPDLGLARPSVYILPGVNTDAPVAGSWNRGVSRNPLTGAVEETTQSGDQPLSDELLQRINLNQESIRQMREEYESGIDGEGAAIPTNPNDLTIARENPINRSLNSRMTSSVGAEAFSGSLDTQQSLQQRLVTASPRVAQQDSQYKAMRDRFERFNQRRAMTDQEANQQFMQDWNAAQQGTDETGQQPMVPLPTIPKPTVEEEQDQLTLGPDRRRLTIRQQEQERQQQQQEGEIKKATEGTLPPQEIKELRIVSLADGVKYTKLKNLMVDAEKNMKVGQFTQALDYYDAAAAVAPDNSIVLMGRALAELGAGYYARAQVHLQEVLSADPALLMARYDLKVLYGEDRLQYIVRDLKDLTLTETRQSRPLFLLGFIAYSTESEESAANYLALAEQRGGSTEFYNQLREYWELNKKKDAPTQETPAPQVQ